MLIACANEAELAWGRELSRHEIMVHVHDDDEHENDDVKKNKKMLHFTLFKPVKLPG